MSSLPRGKARKVGGEGSWSSPPSEGQGCRPSPARLEVSARNQCPALPLERGLERDPSLRVTGDCRGPGSSEAPRSWGHSEGRALPLGASRKPGSQDLTPKGGLERATAPRHGAAKAGGIRSVSFHRGENAFTQDPALVKSMVSLVMRLLTITEQRWQGGGAQLAPIPRNSLSLFFFFFFFKA